MIKTSYYMTGNKQNFIQPQLLSVVASNSGKQCELQLPRHWNRLRFQTDKSYGAWMEQLESRRVRYPGDDHDGYSMDNLVDDLKSILNQWDTPVILSRRHSAAELWKNDVTALFYMSSAWVNHADGIRKLLDNRSDLAIHCFHEAAKLLRKISGVLQYDGPYRLLVGRHTFILSWSDIAKALETVVDDLQKGNGLRENYLIGSSESYERQDAVFMAERT